MLLNFLLIISNFISVTVNILLFFCGFIIKTIYTFLITLNEIVSIFNMFFRPIIKILWAVLVEFFNLLPFITDFILQSVVIFSPFLFYLFYYVLFLMIMSCVDTYVFYVPFLVLLMNNSVSGLFFIICFGVFNYYCNIRLPKKITIYIRAFVNYFYKQLFPYFFNYAEVIGDSYHENRNILWIHPHNISIMQVFFILSKLQITGETVLTDNLFELVPIMGVIVKILGWKKLSKININSAMIKRESIVIILFNDYDTCEMNINISKYRWLFKTGIQNGYIITPAIFYTANVIQRPLFPLLYLPNTIKSIIPRINFWYQRHAFYFVVGKGLVLPRIKNVSTDELNEIIHNYKNVVMKVYEENVQRWVELYGVGSNKIIIK